MKPEKGRSGIERVRLLIDARKGDPLYGDRYAARAAELLRPQLSEETYEALRDSEDTVAEASRQSQLALLHGEWARVKELAAQIGSLRRSAVTRREEMELAQQIYGSAEVPIDPFSPGFGALFGGSSGALARQRDELVRTLDNLAAQDPDWARPLLRAPQVPRRAAPDPRRRGERRASTDRSGPRAAGGARRPARG